MKEDSQKRRVRCLTLFLKASSDEAETFNRLLRAFAVLPNNPRADKTWHGLLQLWCGGWWGPRLLLARCMRYTCVKLKWAV